MPPKNSKKEVQKIQKKVIEDKTFGLKNKNKSKVVQNFVAQVTQQAKQAGLSKEELARQERLRQEKAAKKEEKMANEREQAMLFNPAVKKKLEAAAKKKAAEEEAAAKARAEEGPEIVTAEEAYLEAKRQADMDRADAVLGPQADDDLYDQIEKERAEIRKKGNLTPVTFDSFVAWKARKAEERKQAAVEQTKLAIAAAAKAKGKSGRDLFNHLVATNADLFLDDDDADDDWMKREKDPDEDEEEIFDVTVTGTSLQLKKVEKPSGDNAQAGGEAAAKSGSVEALAKQVDASLFTDDVELPSDDDDD
uniref:ZC3H15/TMA46 family C-terminal domain-containing protein n=1 Tax=Hemiselmis andersenii TaxID=464988 RepID=A0A6T8KYQ7_HEMAN|mmetsp:Transcript_1243/g.2977  ORF Transcript_1243/g.2977 Transcript_1243/m.2977 type:complete len:307 (+) Transcript_1243:198-1118(+)